MSERLAIVGSRELVGNAEAERIIESVLDQYKPEAVVSGGAVGIDQMAARAARGRGIKVVEFLPSSPSWENGFKPRNILIAEGCTRLVRIVSRQSKSYGSGWTRDRAREMGKPTEEHIV